MLVVLAYAHDQSARALVDRWRAAGEDAGVLTCADLSRPGWVFRPGDPANGRAVIEGRTVSSADIRAVIVRMPAIGEAELGHVHAQDRAYAASEMHAFLLAWLASLPCPVLNRPTPYNLGGPAWHTSEWVRRARRLGLAARSVVWNAAFVGDGAPDLPRRLDAHSRFVDVVGGRAFLVGGREPGPDDEALAAAALALARDAGVEVLRAYFEPAPDGPPVFLEAGLWIDITSNEIADALTERCLGFVHARPGVPVKKRVASA